MRRGMTLIEILVVVAIMATVMGLVLAGVGVLRRHTAEQKAATTLTRLHLGIEALILEQGVPMTPALGNDGSGVLDVDPVLVGGVQVPSVAQRLADRGTLSWESGRDLDQERRLVDPWRQPYRFVVGAGSDPDGHVPQDVAASRPEWVPINAEGAPTHRCYVYSYGARNPGGADHDAWAVYRNDR